MISNHYFLAIKFSNTLNFGRVSKYCSDANDPTIEGEFKHEVRQFEKSYDNQQAEQISLMV